MVWFEIFEFKIKFVYKLKNIKLFIIFVIDDRYWLGNNIISFRGLGKFIFWL